MFELFLKAIPRKLGSLFRQPRFILFWLVPVWIALGICRFVILTIPLRFIYRCYGQDGSLSSKAPPISLSKQARARQIRDVVALAARYTPWKSQCYPQALVAHLALSICQIPHVLYFGLRKVDGEAEPYEAHAWVMAGDSVVTGGPHHRSYGVARAFVTGQVTDETGEYCAEERTSQCLLTDAAVSPSLGNAGSAHCREAEALSKRLAVPCPTAVAETSPEAN